MKANQIKVIGKQRGFDSPKWVNLSWKVILQVSAALQGKTQKFLMDVLSPIQNQSGDKIQTSRNFPRRPTAGSSISRNPQRYWKSPTLWSCDVENLETFQCLGTKMDTFTIQCYVRTRHTKRAFLNI